MVLASGWIGFSLLLACFSCAFSFPRAHTPTRTLTRTHPQTPTQTHTNLYTPTHTCTHTRTHTHTLIHTHPHTHTHTHTHILALLFGPRAPPFSQARMPRAVAPECEGMLLRITPHTSVNCHTVAHDIRLRTIVVASLQTVRVHAANANPKNA